MNLENKLSFLKSLEFGMELKKHNGKMGMVKIIEPQAAIFIDLEDINLAETREDLRILYTRALRKTLFFLEVMGFGDCHALKNTPLGLFIQEWEEAKENSSLRDGQLLMNMLAERRLHLYRELTGTDIDPFHNDDLIQKALDHLKKVW